MCRDGVLPDSRWVNVRVATKSSPTEAALILSSQVCQCAGTYEVVSYRGSPHSELHAHDGHLREEEGQTGGGTQSGRGT